MKPSAIAGLRLVIVFALLLSTWLFVHLHSSNEMIPSSEPLASFPSQIGDWTGLEVPISEQVRSVLGAGDFMERGYRSTLQMEPPVDLFVAYFPTQRTGSTIHSPKHCLPGSGWTPLESGYVRFTAGGRMLEINRYVMTKDASRRLVLYWYQAHGRVVASEYWAKTYLVTDAVRMNRTDGALIRMITPIAHGESTEDAQARIFKFAQNIVPILNRYLPD